MSNVVPIVSMAEDLKNDLKLSSSLDKKMQELDKKWVTFDNADKSVLQAVEDYDAYFINSKSSIEYDIKLKYLDRIRQGNSPFHIASECVTHFNIIYPVKKGSPLAELLSDKILNFNQFGLIDKWVQDENGVDLNNFEAYDIDDFVPLNVNHLQGPFLVMPILFGGCLLIFLGEILLTLLDSRMKSKSDNRN